MIILLVNKIGNRSKNFIIRFLLIREAAQNPKMDTTFLTQLNIELENPISLRTIENLSLRGKSRM